MRPLLRLTDVGRLASLGLVAVLVALPGFAIWGAVATYQYGADAKLATVLGDAYEQARYAVGAEESLERKYRLEPSAEVRARHHAAAASLVDALARAKALGGPDDASLVGAALLSHQEYLAAIDRMFAAVDDGDFARYADLDEHEADPAFDQIETAVFAAAAASKERAEHQMRRLARLQKNVLQATPLVFAIGLGLVIFFWSVLRSYQRQVRASAAREAAAVRRSEQHFRSLIQHASDLILICAPAGTITYQSPAAETHWGYPPPRLLSRSLVGLVHRDEQTALRELWAQLMAGSDATKHIELRIRDRAGNWRYAEVVLTSLLHEPSVGGVVVTVHDIHQRKALEWELKQQAFYDSLTGLPNRLLLHDRLKQALTRAARRKLRAGLLFLDLDDFKRVNDSLGHAVGDELLVQAAARLQTCVRAEDTIARLGGDEFVVLLEDLGDEADAAPVADDILRQFARPFTLGDREVVVSASIGIALTEERGDQTENLLRNADVAMYRAKAAGKGRYVAFTPKMHAETLARLNLEGDLRRAIESCELRVHYQPIMSLQSGRMTEIEALVRWQHPVHGLIPPLDFIPLAEDSGLIIPIGQWVLQEACRQVAVWHVQHPMEPPLIVGVNLSPLQFGHPGLVETIAKTLHDTGLPAECLKLEITEGTLMRDTEASLELLWRLKEMGIQLAVDDFGTGYSSLAYLKHLPIDTLKIDRSFVTDIVHDAGDRSIVQAILSLAASLGLSVTAEGVEAADQLKALVNWGCQRAQGYHFFRPLEPSDLAALLTATAEQAATEPASSPLLIDRPVAGTLDRFEDAQAI
jgi:diguanylate cyclase (GGDEF)-like protein/PAS domain S-box-containing protein